MSIDASHSDCTHLNTLHSILISQTLSYLRIYKSIMSVMIRICIRLFIGLAGSTFVMCQCWTTRMFTKEIVGVANGLVGGWGNVGGGATQLVMGTALVSLLLVLDKTIYTFQYTFLYTYSPIFYLCNSILFSS